MAKPNIAIEVWALDNYVLPNTGQLNKKRPIDDLWKKGYDKGQKPTVEDYNYTLNMITQWIRYITTEQVPAIEKVIDDKIKDFEKVVDDKIKEVDKKIDDMEKKLDDAIKDMNNKVNGLNDYLVPIGGVMLWGSTTPPKGWLELNGQKFDKAKNPKLFAALGRDSVWDMRGRVPRGWAHGSTTDSEPNRAILSTQEDAIRNITGGTLSYDRWRAQDGYVGAFQTSNRRWNAEVKSGGNDNWGAYVTFDASRVVPTAAENRMKNIATMFIIKTDQADSGSGAQTPTDIIVSPDSITGKIGGQQRLTATVLPTNIASGFPVSWSTTNASVATVDTTGLVTLRGKGTCQIIASISTGLNSRVGVTVNVLLTSLTLRQPPSIEVEGSQKIVFTAAPTDYSEQILWSSSNPSVASVGADGSVSGVAVGSAVISARGAISGVGASTNVTVIPNSAALPVTDIRFGNAVDVVAREHPVNPNYLQFLSPAGHALTEVGQYRYRDNTDTVLGFVRARPTMKKVGDTWVTVSQLG